MTLSPSPVMIGRAEILSLPKRVKGVGHLGAFSLLGQGFGGAHAGQVAAGPGPQQVEAAAVGVHIHGFAGGEQPRRACNLQGFRHQLARSDAPAGDLVGNVVGKADSGCIYTYG